MSLNPSRLLLFAAILVLQFVLFEAGLRLAGGSEAAPVFQQLFMQDQEMGGYRLKPGATAHYKTAEFETDIVINSSGTRDREILPKPPRERRIVVLGDSLVLSVQVQAGETFCSRLEQRLNDHRAPDEARYRVINAGVQGYGPVEELAFFEHVASRFQADVVLIAIYVGNDAMEASDAGAKILPTDDRSAAKSPPGGLEVKRPSRWPLWLRRLTRNSMVLQIVRMRATTLMERFGQARPFDRALTMYLPTLPPDMARGLEVSRECVRRIAILAAAQGARTGVVLLPARFQVADDDYGYLRAIVEEGGATLVRDAGTARFKDALGSLGLPMMDALSTLRDSPQRAGIFFKTTAHLTVTGHQVLAAGMETFLRRSGLLDTPGSPKK